MIKKSIYIIGSLRNDKIPEVASSLREIGYDVFDDWYSAGKDADDYLRDYYRNRDLTYDEVLGSYAARHIFSFDKKHLDRCDYAVLCAPAGKSAHLELGYFIGSGKPAFILMDQEPERVDIMHNFATKVFMTKEKMIEYFSGSDIQGGSGKDQGESPVRGYAPIAPYSVGSSIVRRAEIRSALVEGSRDGEVQGRKDETSSRPSIRRVQGF